MREVNDGALAQRIMDAQGAKKQDFFHSSAYAKAQNGGAMGVASTESFAARREIGQNRTMVRGYRDARVSQGVNNARPLDAEELKRRAVERAERAKEVAEQMAQRQERAERKAIDKSEEQTAARQYEIVKEQEGCVRAQGQQNNGAMSGQQGMSGGFNYKAMQGYREAQKERFMPHNNAGVGANSGGGAQGGATPMRRAEQFRLRGKGV